MRKTLKTTSAGQGKSAERHCPVESHMIRGEKNAVEEKRILCLEIIDGSNTHHKDYPPEPQQAFSGTFRCLPECQTNCSQRSNLTDLPNRSFQ